MAETFINLENRVFQMLAQLGSDWEDFFDIPREEFIRQPIAWQITKMQKVLD